MQGTICIDLTAGLGPKRCATAPFEFNNKTSDGFNGAEMGINFMPLKYRDLQQATMKISVNFLGDIFLFCRTLILADKGTSRMSGLSL